MISLSSLVLLLLSSTALKIHLIMAETEFEKDLFSLILRNRANQNIVYSPVFIHAYLSLLYFLADGHTATELRRALRLDSPNKRELAARYEEYFKYISGNAAKGASPFIVANSFQINVPDVLIETFQRGEKKEKLNGVLVNQITFSAKWLRPFSVSQTRKRTFSISQRKKIEVETMTTHDFFRYAHLPQLEAEALEMPYNDKNLNMLIILPNNFTVLERLQNKLQRMDLNDISSQMVLQTVAVVLPKFRIKFRTFLREPLERMNCTTMFEKRTNFNYIGRYQIHYRLLNIQHKVFLSVNEAGSRAVAANHFNYFNKLPAKLFLANRPFFFFIRSKIVTYFAGFVGKF